MGALYSVMPHRTMRERPLSSVRTMMMTDLSRFYGDALPMAERETYEALKAGLLSHQKDIRCPFSPHFEKAVRAVNYDCPSLFYINWVESFRYAREGEWLFFSFPYLYEREECAAMEARLLSYAQQVAGISVYGKVRTLHDKLSRSLSYDSAGLSAAIRSPAMFSALGPLLYRRAVCEGISKFACLVLRQLGVDAAVAVGRHRGVGHSWNVYRHEDGRIAYTDITFDIALKNTPAAYRYFDLDRAAMGRDHDFEF